MGNIPDSHYVNQSSDWSALSISVYETPIPDQMTMVILSTSAQTTLSGESFELRCVEIVCLEVSS